MYAQMLLFWQQKPKNDRIRTTRSNKKLIYLALFASQIQHLGTRRKYAEIQCARQTFLTTWKKNIKQEFSSRIDLTW